MAAAGGLSTAPPQLNPLTDQMIADAFAAVPTLAAAHEILVTRRGLSEHAFWVAVVHKYLCFKSTPLDAGRADSKQGIMICRRLFSPKPIGDERFYVLYLILKGLLLSLRLHLKGVCFSRYSGSALRRPSAMSAFSSFTSF